jgi:hypothetical protein
MSSTNNTPVSIEIEQPRLEDETYSLLNKNMDEREDGDNNDKRETLKDDAFTRNLKLAFCFLGLQVSYVLWGVAQEQIMTQVYKPGKFTSSTVRVNL